MYLRFEYFENAYDILSEFVRVGQRKFEGHRSFWLGYVEDVCFAEGDPARPARESADCRSAGYENGGGAD